MKYDYEKIVELRKQTAKTIWDNAFFTGLSKLTRKQLYECIEVLVSKLDENQFCSDGVDERFWKDIAFDRKCLLIECLDEDFFKSED